MNTSKIIVTSQDYEILKKLAENMKRSAKRSLPHINRFITEIDLASITDSRFMPEEIVSLRSRVTYTYLETGKRGVAVVVFPAELAYNPENVSILTPFGMALIGEREGTTVEYEAPGGKFKIQVEKVEHPISHSG